MIISTHNYVYTVLRNVFIKRVSAIIGDLKKGINKMRFYLLLITLSCLISCASTLDLEKVARQMYNVPSTGENKFDENKYIRMSNLRCHSVLMELYQDTALVNHGVVLVKAGPNYIENVASGNALFFKIDGEVIPFRTNDVTTDYDSIYLGHGVDLKFSNKTFSVSEEIIHRAAAANEFLVKVNLLGNEYIEGKCSHSSLKEAQLNSKDLNITVQQQDVDFANSITAIEGFKVFVDMMGTLK